MLPSIPCPIFRQAGIQFLSCRLFILPHNPIHIEHMWHEVTSSLKAGLDLFPLFLLLMLRQYFLWLFQKVIYKLFLTKLPQSDCPISVPSQQRPSYPHLMYPLPIHISKLLTSLVLMPPIRPLAYVLIARAYHYVAPTPARWRHAPGSGRDGPVYIRIFLSIPCPIFLSGQNPFSYLPCLSFPP